jgi:hypothetical protein
MIDFDKTIGKSFSSDFCDHLEYHLTRAFLNAPRTNKFECVWCDGVEVPDARDTSMENLIDNREIVTRAWSGFSGQDIYKMTIRLGDKSWEKCLKGHSLIKCLPSDKSIDWVDLDIENRTIILQLK